jgi:hypothetical protein
VVGDGTVGRFHNVKQGDPIPPGVWNADQIRLYQVGRNQRIWAGMFSRASTERTIGDRRKRPESEVRAFVVVKKPGNSGGAKGRRKMDV